MSLGVPLLGCLDLHIWKANFKRVSSLSAYFLSPIGVCVCVSGLGEVSSFKALEVSLPLQACGLRSGRPARPLQGPPALRGKGDQVTEASPFKFICGGRMSAQGVGGLSLSWSNLAFAGLSGGARKFGARRGWVPRFHFPGRSRAVVQGGLLVSMMYLFGLIQAERPFFCSTHF